ncbi:uncharacterized protein LOC124457148 [Xenia sp. Carnegie-2017]|uniref:uncharacterized protein LOC124457148 n=1 Tax=Xenia sp. Carnegie-2017 TaxID=2897299 RepID=UPI001F03AF11|nr:uncharacterized protein LOC124457148 [Xenia sp. Carnegie-2017]
MRNITSSKIDECLEQCLKDCSCLSFQLCGTASQLLSSTITDETKNMCSIVVMELRVVNFKLRARYEYEPFYKNFPRNETNETWEDHRLSFDAMMSIKEGGNTLWRITCSYGDKDWNKTDLVVATHEKYQFWNRKITLPFA